MRVLDLAKKPERDTALGYPSGFAERNLRRPYGSERTERHSGPQISE
jgi:hypothetical protein